VEKAFDKILRKLNNNELCAVRQHVTAMIDKRQAFWDKYVRAIPISSLSQLGSQARSILTRFNLQSPAYTHEDLLHDAMIRVARHSEPVNDDTFMKIMYNTMESIADHRARARALHCEVPECEIGPAEEPADAIASLAVTSTTPEDLLIEKETLLTFLMSFPCPEARILAVLKDVVGFSAKEVQKILAADSKTYDAARKRAERRGRITHTAA
jgi:DNA-directed RNA polymerase specialized sigma24 family protein